MVSLWHDCAFDRHSAPVTPRNPPISQSLPEPIADAIAGGTCLRLVLSRKRKSADDKIDKVTLRPVRVGESAGYQLAQRTGSKELHENLPPVAALQRIERYFGSTFLDCHCFTVEADWTARLKRGNRFQLTKKKPTRAAAPTEHDREKCHVLAEGMPVRFLEAIGVMTAKGRVRQSKYAKFRQINRYLELVDDVLDALPAEGPLHVVDYGCGKSYLTFGLYHLLHELRGREVTITGLDLQEDVIANCNRIAGELGWDGVRFRVGHIGEHDPGRDVDLAVSLHACDTATDDALTKAVAWNAKVILAAPCCQHELLPTIHSEVLAPLEAHGLLKERFASLATDTLRAAALDLAGYRTQVVEFVSLEHTAKNLLLRAVRRETDPASQDARRTEYEALKSFLGLDGFRLDDITRAE